MRDRATNIMTVATPCPLEHLFPFHIRHGFKPENYRDRILNYRHRVLFGESEQNIPGILNHPEIPRFFACHTKNVFSRDLAWRDIIFSGIQSLRELTNGIEAPDSLLLPYALNPSAMLLNYLHEMCIKSIGVLPELSQEFMPFGDTALLYTKSDSKFEVFVNQFSCDAVVHQPYSLAMIMGI